MEKDKFGDLEGKPRFEYLSQELRDALDAAEVAFQREGITPIAFIGVVPKQGLVFQPMASMSDAEAKRLTERFLPVVLDALRESGNDRLM